MSKDFPVTGLKELNSYLSALPVKLQKGAYRAGMTAAAGVVRDEARLRARGRIKKAIRSGSPRVNQDGTISIRVYVDERKGSGGFVGYFLEYGVRPHFIQGGDSGLSAKLLTRKAQAGGVQGDAGTKRLKIGDKWITGDVFHPGFAPKPFLRPALDAKAQEAVKAMAVRIASYIEGKTGFNPAVAFDEAA